MRLEIILLSLKKAEQLIGMDANELKLRARHAC